MYFGGSQLEYDQLVAFLIGLDIGAQGAVLDGFHEYLLLRLGEESSRGWPWLVLQITVPQTASHPGTDTDDQAAVAGLFDVLDEFLAEFPASRSRSRLYHEYFLWKQQLSFYDLDLERFRSSPAPDTVKLDEAGRMLNLSRGQVFDLAADGQLEIFRASGEALVRRSRVEELRNRPPAPTE
jgi:hypothetical protein